MKFENTEVNGFEAAFRGMRQPMQSFDRANSKNDLELGMRLSKAGEPHRKYLRMINVTVDIEAPVYFIQELDTYKIGTTRNSSSLQHKGASRNFEIEDFEIDSLDDLLDEYQILIDGTFRRMLYTANYLKDKYNVTKDYKYFRLMRQLLPMSYNYKLTWQANYEVLANIYKWRKNHKLIEWHNFCEWIESLPHSELITLKESEG